MEPDEVRALYGGAYAANYNSIWQENGRWEAEAQHHLRALRALVRPDTRWLDVGCGTGWNLSHFPGVPRAGVDLSPDMLEQARAGNPDALFLHQGDLRDDVEEWHDAWDLVTCTGQPWSYLRTMDEIEVALENLARWTAPNGVCFAPMGDLTDLTGQSVPFPFPGEPIPYDTPMISGVVWSLHESDRDHVNMIWPSVGFCVGVLARHFRRIEIQRWPHEPAWLPVARRVLVASEKRTEGDARPAVIVEHPVPSASSEPVDDRSPLPSSNAGEDRPAASSGGAGEHAAPVTGEHLVSSAGADRRLYDQPLSYLVGRFRPWRRSFWRTVLRRLRSVGR